MLLFHLPLLGSVPALCLFLSASPESGTFPKVLGPQTLPLLDLLLLSLSPCPQS